MFGVGDKFKVEITEDEAKIYDRQIRLWGLDAQKRLRAARVLIIGLGGLGSEIAKNLILAGIKSIHFMDDCTISEKDLKSNIFIRKTDLGTNRAVASTHRAKPLNPMVEVTAECASIKEKSLDFFSNYDVICATALDWTSFDTLDVLCRKGGVKLFLGGCFGLFGYMLSDLGTHEYAYETKIISQDLENEKAKMDDLETKIVRKVMEFPSMQDVLAYKWPNNGSQKMKDCPTGYFFCKVISEFISQCKRAPELESMKEDKNILEKIRDQVLKDLSIDEQCIPLDYFEECYSEINPLCAVVGGIIAQDVLKTVSQKDQPHNNFFFFNGITGCGSVDRVAAFLFNNNSHY